MNAATRRKTDSTMLGRKNRIRRKPTPEGIDREEITTSYDMLVFGKDEEKLSYTLANCCNPIPGDEVFGFVTVKDGIKVHKKDCLNSISLQSNYAYRIISAKWIDSSQEEFTAEIRLSGIDTLGLINSITEIISDEMHVNMRNINFNMDGGIFNGIIARMGHISVDDGTHARSGDFLNLRVLRQDVHAVQLRQRAPQGPVFLILAGLAAGDVDFRRPEGQIAERRQPPAVGDAETHGALGSDTRFLPAADRNGAGSPFSRTAAR